MMLKIALYGLVEILEVYHVQNLLEVVRGNVASFVLLVRDNGTCFR